MNDGDALLGLSEYEGRLYRALLQEGTATAYRAGKASGVPLSRAYEVAERLVQKGAASRLDGEPARYTPTPPREMLDAARARQGAALDALAGEFASLASGARSQAGAWLHGQESVLQRVATIVAGARVVVVTADAVALAHLRAAAEGVRRRGTRVTFVHADFGAGTTGTFALTADGREALVGRLGPAADALHTHHPAVVAVCDQFVRSHAEQHAPQDRPQRVRSQAGLAPPAGWLDWEEEKQRRLLTQAH